MTDAKKTVAELTAEVAELRGAVRALAGTVRDLVPLVPVDDRDALERDVLKPVAALLDS